MAPFTARVTTLLLRSNFSATARMLYPLAHRR